VRRGAVGGLASSSNWAVLWLHGRGADISGTEKQDIALSLRFFKGMAERGVYFCDGGAGPRTAASPPGDGGTAKAIQARE
jgi:hypothetical protein